MAAPSLWRRAPSEAGTHQTRSAPSRRGPRRPRSSFVHRCELEQLCFGPWVILHLTVLHCSSIILIVPQGHLSAALSQPQREKCAFGAPPGAGVSGRSDGGERGRPLVVTDCCWPY